MGTADGSAGGSSPTSGGNDVSLNAERVRGIADKIGTKSETIARSGFADAVLSPSAFGGSVVGQELASLYERAHADSVLRNDETETMLVDYQVGLRGAVQDQLDTDELNAAALRGIGAIDPGEA